MAKDFDPGEIMAVLYAVCEEEARAVMQRMLGMVVLSTPIGMPHLWQSPPPKDYKPGNARGSWNVSVGQADETWSKTHVDPSGAQTIARGESVIREYHFPARFYLTNAAPHIVPLDEGWSKQAPAGFTAKALEVARASLAGDRKELP